MAESVYKVVEVVGTSTDSWEKAAKAAVERAAKSLRDLRVAEVVEQDIVIEKGKVAHYRTNELPFHLKRALENGVTKAELIEVITHLAFYSGWPTAMTAGPSVNVLSTGWRST